MKDYALRQAAKEHERVKYMTRLKEFFEKLDTNHDGRLSLQELFDGFDNVPEIRHHCFLLNLGRDDLENLFSFLDDDESVSLDYREFVDNLFTAQVQDLR